MRQHKNLVKNISLASVFFWSYCSLTTAAPLLFGYQEISQADLAIFSQWSRVIERHASQDFTPEDCKKPSFNACHLNRWHTFIDSIRHLSTDEKLNRVNEFANKTRYVLDIDNYGVTDYWAIVREFLPNGGDCEDYSLTKLFSLLWLGFDPASLRIVVLQDTNLRVPHAVLAVYHNNEILILDNQIKQIVPHHQIVHYVPVYSINESGWWIHTPAS